MRANFLGRRPTWERYRNRQLRASRDAGVEHRASPENPSTSLSNPAQWLIDWVGGGTTVAGVSIDQESGQKIVAVGSAIRVVAETLSTIPVQVFRRDGESGRRLATDHPLYGVLHDEPNRDESSSVWRDRMQTDVESRGNAYAEIVRTGASIELRALPAACVEPFRTESGELWYSYEERPGEKPRMIRPRDMLHIPGPGFDGLRGRSPISWYRESLGLTSVTEQFGAKWFADGSRPSMVLTHPGRPDRDEAVRIRADLEARHAGMANAHGLLVLPAGMEAKAMTIPPEDAQFILTREFQVLEVCRIWRVQPHKIMFLRDAKHANIEAQNIEFTTDTVRPRVVRWEQELNRKLFGAGSEYFCEFNLEGLLRGDLKSRADAYAVFRQWGLYSANEIRALENLNPIPAEQGGDDYWRPVNVQPTDEPITDEEIRQLREAILARRRAG